jgi:hypothetical protein
MSGEKFKIFQKLQKNSKHQPPNPPLNHPNHNHYQHTHSTYPHLISQNQSFHHLLNTLVQYGASGC